jgi:hypothetical protein
LGLKNTYLVDKAQLDGYLAQRDPKKFGLVKVDEIYVSKKRVRLTSSDGGLFFWI